MHFFVGARVSALYYVVMNNLVITIITLFGSCLLYSCAGEKPVVEEKIDEPELDKLVARVASVNKEANYVLIQRYGKLVVPEDSVLYTLGVDGHAASIKVTGERLGQFLAADIVSGELIVGDAVYLRNLEKKANTDSH